MAKNKVEIGILGIKKTLNKFEPVQAIAEYVWNGFDAGATSVNIQIPSNEIGYIEQIKISDNGSGIPLTELERKFSPFLHTSRVIDPTVPSDGPSALHGKNGVGRLTFFNFAVSAEWLTNYEHSDGVCRQYTVLISASNLNEYDYSEELVTSEPSGTTVTFTDILDINALSFIPELRTHLAKEFAWFLELGSPHQRIITINGDKIDYTGLIADKSEFDIPLLSEAEFHTFNVRYIRWSERPKREYSRYYFIGSDRRERAKKTTTFNNKGDDFHHSVYVSSPYFDFVEEFENLTSEYPHPMLPFAGLEREEVFKDLLKELDEYLQRKRVPFLKKRARRLVQQMKRDNSFPHFGNELWEQHKKKELTEVVVELYEVEPRIFNGLNVQQKKALLRLLSLVMESSERSQLLQIVEQVVNLEPSERVTLAKILESTRLTNVIATIKLLEDRFVAVSELKRLVFDKSFGANERDHLQTHIQHHYWLFGEEYHLVTAAEPDFEQALRRFLHLIRDTEDEVTVDHPDKNKEMDIFMVRRLKRVNAINNVVVELKHPQKTLGAKELEQVKKYLGVIIDQPEFNGQSMTWEFYLVGNKCDSYMEGEWETAKANGKRHLVYKRANYEIYVLTWSDVITNFELRHEFLLSRLKLEREKLATQEVSADGVLQNGYRHNSAVLGEATNPIPE